MHNRHRTLTENTHAMEGGSFHKQSRVIAPSLFAYQKLAQFVVRPQIRKPANRIVLSDRCRKSLVIKILDNYFEDKRPKILIFPNEGVCKQFYEELAIFENKYLEHAVGKIGPVQYDRDTNKISAPWMEAFKALLEMKGSSYRRAGETGFLAAPLRAYEYRNAASKTVQGSTLFTHWGRLSSK